ncbi:MAG TPA: cation:proton antiporter [Stellaceae bacterium]|nr:cation:proton antiporter [Stellaceae bacterium]
MIDIAVVVLTVTALLVPASFIQPLAERLHLPQSILLAVVGIVIGGVSAFLLYSPVINAFDEIVRPLVELPFTSETFIIVFLPILLFQTALTIDVREMVEDAAPILVLAVIAVIVAAVGIGFGLSVAGGVPLAVAMLLGAIVATTDPAAVVAIFRELGAPARLVRLVEGESLLNDAAAIVLFTILLEVIVSGHHPSALAMSGRFVEVFAGGVILGLVAARLYAMLLPLLDGARTAEASLTVALPYVVFILGDQVFDVSGVVAVVVAGLAAGISGRARLSPENWAFLENVWEQIGFIAGSLIFILASIQVPKLLGSGVTWRDLKLLVVLIVTAFGARALVIFALLPVLSALRLGQRVSNAYKVVITWGGLRGAVTLALALGVTERQSLDASTQRLITVLATGFVMFTLGVNGLTLRPLIKLLRLDRLSPLNQALRSKVFAVSLADVRDSVRETAAQYKIDARIEQAVERPYDERIASAASATDLEEAISDHDRITIGLVALTNRERQLILDHHGQGTIEPAVIERVLLENGNLLDAAKAGGIAGYAHVAEQMIRYRWSFRAAHFLHRRLGWDQPLRRELSSRFEVLLVRHLVLEALKQFAQHRLAPLIGGTAAAAINEAIAARANSVGRALEALRLQYPDHADALEQRFLQQCALLKEFSTYRELFDEGLIGRELFDDLRRDLESVRRRARARPPLDLGLNPLQLLQQLDLFKEFTQTEVTSLARRFRPRLTLPDEVVIRKGERGDSAFIISSGAVEVMLPGRGVRLGCGEVFGEMALLTGNRRLADVVSLGYCQLLVLTKRDFQRFLGKHPHAKAEIERIAAERAITNIGQDGAEMADLPDPKV